MIIKCQRKLSPGGGEMTISDQFVTNFYGIDPAAPPVISFETDVVESALAICYVDRTQAQQIVDHLTRVFSLEKKA